MPDLLYQSGLCSSGLHEGIRAKNFRGNPLPTCMMLGKCKCNCHAEIDKLYSEIGEARVLMQNPDWFGAPKPTYVMPVFGVDYRVEPDQSNLLEVKGAKQIAGKIFVPTPSGRSSQGELEAKIFEVWSTYLSDLESLPEELQWDFTPAWCAQELARYYQCDLPSTGAITEVFKRWAAYGYADLQTKPIRLYGLMTQVQVDDLPSLRAKYKRFGGR